MFKNFKQNSFLTLSIGIVYLWFGALKFFPELSPAEGLATDTIDKFTFGYLPNNIAIYTLAFLEVVIGCSFVFNIYRKHMVIVALGHLVCTFAPFFFFTDLTFNSNPLALTLVGQYIVKNLVLIAALLSIFKIDKNQQEKVSMHVNNQHDNCHVLRKPANVISRHKYLDRI